MNLLTGVSEASNGKDINRILIDLDSIDAKSEMALGKGQFVIKTKSDTGLKIFINVRAFPKLFEKFELDNKSVENIFNTVVGEKRESADRNGNSCTIVDAMTSVKSIELSCDTTTDFVERVIILLLYILYMFLLLLLFSFIV